MENTDFKNDISKNVQIPEKSQILTNPILANTNTTPVLKTIPVSATTGRREKNCDLRGDPSSYPKMEVIFVKSDPPIQPDIYTAKRGCL